jgi:hypothetical protein
MVLSCVPLLALSVASCSSSPSAPTVITLLDTTLAMTPGVTCQTGGFSTDFMGTAGKTVVITGTGSATQTPRFTLYGPDFTRELGGSSPAGAGAASLTIGLTETGVHHATFCDINGVGGTIRVTVKQQQ